MNIPTQAPKLLQLPPLVPERMRLLNAVSLRGLVHEGRIGEKDFRLRWLPAVPVFKPVLLVRLSVNGQGWTAAFDGASVASLHPLFAEPEAVGTDPATLPAALLGAVLDDLTQSLLEGLSAAIGLSVHLEETLPADTPEAQPFMGALLEWTDRDGVRRQAFMRFASTPAAALALADGLRAVKRTSTGFLTNDIDRIPYVLGVVAGESALSYADYRALSPGDVVVPDAWTASSGEVGLVVRGPRSTLLEGRAKLEEQNNITLGEAMALAQENSMQNTDDLEVKLTFELDNRILTVGELKSLEPGYTFRLTKDAGSIVTVLANGRPVARGCLVDIGGAVGVQLTERVASGANDEH